MFTKEYLKTFIQEFPKRVAEYTPIENAVNYGVSTTTIYAWMKRYNCQEIYKNKKRKDKIKKHTILFIPKT